MPFNLQVRDEVPYLTMRGAENVSHGIAQFGAGLGRMLEGFAAKKEQQKNEAKMATSMRKTLKDIDAANAGREGREPNPHQFDLMGPDDLSGAFRAIGVKSALEEAALNRQMKEGAIRGQQREEANFAAAPGFFATLGQRAQNKPSNAEMTDYYEGNREMPPDRPFNPYADVAAAAAETGYNPGNQFNEIINAMRRDQGWNLKPGATVDLPGGGMLVPTSQSQYQVVTAGGGGANAAPAENYPWLYSDNQQEVEAALKKLSPVEMKRAVAARKAIKTMNGTQDPLQRFLDALGGSGGMGAPGGGGRAGAGAKPALRFRKNAKGEVEQY